MLASHLKLVFSSLSERGPYFCKKYESPHLESGSGRGDSHQGSASPGEGESRLLLFLLANFSSCGTGSVPPSHSADLSPTVRTLSRVSQSCAPIGHGCQLRDCLWRLKNGFTGRFFSSRNILGPLSPTPQIYFCQLSATFAIAPTPNPNEVAATSPPQSSFSSQPPNNRSFLGPRQITRFLAKRPFTLAVPSRTVILTFSGPMLTSSLPTKMSTLSVWQGVFLKGDFIFDFEFVLLASEASQPILMALPPFRGRAGAFVSPSVHRRSRWISAGAVSPARHVRC